MRKYIDRKIIKWKEKYGDLSKDVYWQINQLISEFQNQNQFKSIKNQSFALKGSISNKRFIREYRGINHEVILQNGVYSYNGTNYKSLSAIAYKITGTKWNGKRFFGLIK